MKHVFVTKSIRTCGNKNSRVHVLINFDFEMKKVVKIPVEYYELD